LYPEKALRAKTKHAEKLIKSGMRYRSDPQKPAAGSGFSLARSQPRESNAGQMKMAGRAAIFYGQGD
jgi:hypothetical protein